MFFVVLLDREARSMPTEIGPAASPLDSLQGTEVCCGSRAGRSEIQRVRRASCCYCFKIGRSASL